MSERVLVTGATGQIGKRLVAALLTEGHEVVALARGDTAALSTLPVSFVRGDVLDSAAIELAIQGCTQLYHLAGGIRGAGAVDAAALNLGAARVVVDVAVRHKKQLRSLVFTSSCAVYGDRAGAWVDEGQAPSPATAYGHAKVASEATFLRAAREHGLAARVARLAAVYGPAQRLMRMPEIRAGRAFLPGDGQNLLPLVHVDDAVAALMRIAERGENARIYNVAGRSEPELRSFYAAITQAVGGGPVRFLGGPLVGPLLQVGAELNQRVQSSLGRKPRYIPDNLRLNTASLRMRTDRLGAELEFSWSYPDPVEAILTVPLTAHP